MLSDRQLVRNVVVVCAILILLYFAWLVVSVLLMVFASILLAVAFRGLATPVARFTHMPVRYAVFPVTIGLVGIIGMALYLFGSTIQTQMFELVENLPAAWAALEARFHLQSLSVDLLQQAEAAAPSSATIIATLQGVTSNVFEGLVGLFLVVVGGIYFAVDPELYHRLVLAFWPEEERDRVEASLKALGADLLAFLKAQFIAMVVVGLLTFIGLTIVGVPSAMALAIFACLAEFVPLIGPIVSAVPALLIALTMGMDAALWTLLVFVVVQQSESNVITPLLQQRMVALPPAITLFAVVVFGQLFGLLGIILATPLTVLTFSVIRNRPA
ncbi:AI-2E family transporter [Xanthobacter sp. TB0139]|uniref:AI-2E family transporter n=1 Tax=Xanthobacter sp. TB0139 TaxID=3459178 RepID=UPI004039566E